MTASRSLGWGWWWHLYALQQFSGVNCWCGSSSNLCPCGAAHPQRPAHVHFYEKSNSPPLTCAVSQPEFQSRDLSPRTPAFALAPPGRPLPCQLLHPVIHQLLGLGLQGKHVSVRRGAEVGVGVRLLCGMKSVDQGAVSICRREVHGDRLSWLHSAGPDACRDLSTSAAAASSAFESATP